MFQGSRESLRLEKSDYRIRVYLATQDTCPAERLDGEIGDAVCDGGSLKCTYFSVFDNMNDDEISNLSRAEVQELEEKAAEKNAWACCYDLALSVDGAPGPHNTLNCYVTSKKDYFFFNSEYLKQYQDKKDKEKTPGCNYFQQIENFFRLHYERGKIKQTILYSTLLQKT